MTTRRGTAGVLFMALIGSAVACSDKGPSEPPPPPDTQLAYISPTSVAAGSPDLTVALTGAGFRGGQISSQAAWRTADSITELATTFVNAGRLTAVIPAALLRDMVSAQVYVLTRDRMENVTVAQSNAVRFDVTQPPGGMLLSISPTSVAAGSSDLTLILTGVGFRGARHNSSEAVWRTKNDTTGLATTYVDSARLTAVIPAALLRDTVTAQVFVLTGDPMGDDPLAQSNVVTFTVRRP